MSTANPQRGEVDITLDRPRIMRLDFPALAKAEVIGGFSMFSLRRQALGVNEFRAFGYAGLLKDDPKLTLAAFDALIETEQNFTDLMKAVVDALDMSFKKSGDEANPQKPEANNGTGLNSSQPLAG